MKHRALLSATGFLVAAVLMATGQAHAASGDPTGIWRKAQQGERPGKVQVFRCGPGKKYICAKIVWLQNPNDLNGRPLRDVRNENPSLRGRPIMGLPIINGLAPAGPNVWKGNIYNPEDGNTYSATLTLVSRNQIKLKGCKAWLLCGERTWLRTSLPKPEPEPEPEPQIEASVEPEGAPQPVAAKEEALTEEALADAEMLTPAVQQSVRPGYRFLNTSATAKTDVELSGENVNSMFVMTQPIETESEPTAKPVAAPAPKPQAQPRPQSIQANASSAPRPTPASARPAADSSESPIDDMEAVDTESMETATVEEVPLTRRQRRLLRRKQQREGGLLPWQN